jgi:prepilin-type N-terminal cleavage/methylation domain-containing protein
MTLAAPRSNCSPRRIGFTLVELLVVIAIIGILLSIMLPVMSSSRESASRLRCTSNLTNVGLATRDYIDAYEVFPMGTVASAGPIQSLPQGMHHSWITRLLPYLDHPAAFSAIDFSSSVYSKSNEIVRRQHIPKLLCPSDSRSRFDKPASSYAGCHNDVEAPIAETNNGVFFLNSKITMDDLADGGSQTLLIGEKLLEPGDLGWMSGTRATLRNAGHRLNETSVNQEEDDAEHVDEPVEGDGDNQQPDPNSPPPPQFVGGFSSAHGDGVNFLFANGTVQFLSPSIDQQVLQQLANRGDGQPLSWPIQPR